MAINKKLISFATQAQFAAQLSAGNIDNRSIVFIEDKKRIWTHGVFFDTSWDFVTDRPTQLSQFTDDIGVSTAQARADSAWTLANGKWTYNASTIQGVKVNNATQADVLEGTINNYVETLTTTTGAINLNSGNVFYRNATANTTFSITNAKAGAHSFTLIITMGATVRTLTFPASVKWQDGEVPEMTEANKTYILTFMTINSGTTWFGMEGGSF